MSLLAELVAFNTESSRSNLALVRRAESVLSDVGAATAVKKNAAGDKASLFATIGPAVSGGVVLSGHSDVVDALKQTWRSPPFELTEADGRLHARGACDMKGFVACALAQAPAFAAAKLKRPLHVALSRDEEIGSIGMPDMLAMIAQTGLSPAAAIVGEPTRMRVVSGHKAGYEMRTTFTGVAAHSSLPAAGASAIVPAARFAVFLAALSESMARTPAAGSPFEPPHGIINVGIVRGGSARNIVADHCEVQWHYRPLPEDDAAGVVAQAERYCEEELLPMMRVNGHAAEIKTITDAYYPGLAPRPGGSAVRLAQTLLDDDSPPAVAPYGADAGYFQQAGIPAVLVGPGDIAQAHKPDEFIAVSELERCLRFLDALLVYLRQ